MREPLISLLFWFSTSTPQFRGKFRVIRALHDSLLRKPQQRLIEAGGAIFEVLGKDLIEFRLLFYNENSPEIASTLTRLLGTGDKVLWDVGANIGSVSLPLAKQVPGLRIVAFEPSPHVLTKLVNNVGLNPDVAERITVTGAALSNASGLVPFFVSNEDFNSGVGGLHRSVNREDYPVNVWSVRGDDLIRDRRAPRPDVIKIDVEGGEFEVLDGLQDTLASADRMAIVFEHDAYRFEERDQPKDLVVKLLQRHGFELSVVEPDGSERPFEPDDIHAAHHDFIARKG